jgi:hypothetical protein
MGVCNSPNRIEVQQPLAAKKYEAPILEGLKGARHFDCDTQIHRFIEKCRAHNTFSLMNPPEEEKCKKDP